MQIREKDYSPESYKLTTVLAKLNPDFYTVWNYRKDFLQIQLESEALYSSLFFSSIIGLRSRRSIC